MIVDALLAASYLQVVRPARDTLSGPSAGEQSAVFGGNAIEAYALLGSA